MAVRAPTTKGRSQIACERSEERVEIRGARSIFCQNRDAVTKIGNGGRTRGCSVTKPPPVTPPLDLFHSPMKCELAARGISTVISSEVKCEMKHWHDHCMQKGIILSTSTNYHYCNVKVILAVHYFGFSSKIQSLVELCNAHEVKVIEDCSHSFLTSIGGEPVGSFGHVAIFSMRKTLPVYDGGALRINETIEYESQNKSGDSRLGAELAYLISRLVESLVSLIGVPNIYSTKLTGLKERMRALLPHNDNNNIIFNYLFSPKYLIFSIGFLLLYLILLK